LTTATSDILADNIALLRQGLDLVGRLDPAVYAGEGEPAGRGVGAQFRHALDHYTSLLAGAASGVIDYDLRERDPRLECEADVAMMRIVELMDELERLDRGLLDRPAALRTGADETPEGTDSSPSSVRRELHFLLSHTVHHYALIAMLLARRGVEVDETFGVAPSTLRHWARRERCERPTG
jgi:hypothetical protein